MYKNRSNKNELNIDAINENVDNTNKNGMIVYRDER
jgi:hypothetical protein